MARREDMIAEAARRLCRANALRCEAPTFAVLRRSATDIGRACGLVIQCPGSKDNPNPTVEAIISAADELAAAERGRNANLPTEETGRGERHILLGPPGQFADDVSPHVR